MPKKLRYLFLFTCILGIIYSCGKEEQKETEELSTEQTSSTEETAVTEAPLTEEAPEEDLHEGEAVSFYTGEWIDESLAYVRPLAVMIENTKITLPQYGLGQADIIYECPVEGGISRLMAIFQDYSGMERIGNVRSCRLYYIYFAKEFDAAYFHNGRSRFAVKVLNSGFIDHVEGITWKGEHYYYYDNERKIPHNLYTSSELLANAMKDYGFETVLDVDTKPYWKFAADAPNLLEDGRDAVIVSPYYVNPKPWFEYHADDEKYYRYEFGEPQIDGLTGEQLAVTNIIIQNCPVKLKDAKDGSLEIDWLAGGSGVYITKGRAVDITWSRESDTSRTRYYDAAGNELAINPGKTWVEITDGAKAERNKIYSSKEEFQ